MARSRPPRAAAAATAGDLVALLGTYDATLLADDARNYVAATEAACELLGRPMEAVLRLTVDDLAPPEARPWVADAWAQFIVEGRQAGSMVIERPDGSVRHVEFSAQSNVAPGIHRSVLRDVSDRVTAEVALRSAQEEISLQRSRADRTETQLLLALGQIPTVVWSQDLELRYTYASQTRHGLPAGIVGMTDAEVWPLAEDVERLSALKRRALATGTRVDEELVLTYPEGPRICQISIAPLLDANGRPLGITGATTDVTVLRESERSAQRSRDELVAMVEDRTRELSESRRLSDILFAELDVVTWVEDLRTGGRTYVSPGIARILGLPEAEFFKEERLLARVHPDDRPALRYAFEHPESSDVEFRMDAVAETTSWLRRRTSVVRDVHGEPVLRYGIALNVTSTRQAEAEREAAVRTSEQRLRELIEGIDAVVGYGESDGKLVVSEQVRELLGREPASLTDLAAWDALVHPDDYPACRKIWDGPNQTWTMEYRLLHADGRWIWIRDRSRRLFELSGTALTADRHFFVLTDVTALREAEVERIRAVEESEALYRGLIESLDMITWVSDADADVDSYMSPQVERILGYPASRWTEPGFWKTTIHPEDQEELYRVSALPDEAAEPEYRVIAADGRVVWFLDRWRTFVDETGRRSRRVGISLDITARKEAEARLAEAEARYRRLIERQNAFFWEEDLPSHEIRYISPQAAVMTGYPVERWLTERWFWRSLLHPDDRERVLASYRVGTSDPLEYRFLRSDGRAVWVREHATVVTDDAGVPVRLMGVVFDITALRAADEERRMLEERLDEVARLEALARVAATTAHDFGNVLLGIDLFSRHLGLEPGLSEKARADVARIRDAVEQGRNAATSLVSLGRLADPALVSADVHEALAGLELSLAGLLGPGIELHLELAAPNPVVELDPGALERSLINLALNARDAMPDATGRVTISTKEVEEDETVPTSVGIAYRGRYLSLGIADTGTGMDRLTLARAFEPYFTTKPVGKGTGLGLSSVHALVRAADGHIHATSAPGEGTRFRICLPLFGSVEREREREQAGGPGIREAEGSDGPAAGVAPD